MVLLYIQCPMVIIIINIETRVLASSNIMRIYYQNMKLTGGQLVVVCTYITAR